MTPSSTPVDRVAGRDSGRHRSRELAGGHRISLGVHRHRAPKRLHHEPGPVDCGGGGHDAVVVTGIVLRFHQSLTPARRAPVEIGISRRDAVHRFGQRLAGHGHLVNPDMSVVPDELPVQPAVRIQREAPAPALVARIRRARGVAECHRPIHSVFVSTRETSASGSQKASVPVGGRNRDPYPHLVSGRCMSRDRRNPAYRGIVRIDSHRLDRRIRYRNRRQALARPQRAHVGDRRVGRCRSGSGTARQIPTGPQAAPSPLSARVDRVGQEQRGYDQKQRPARACHRNPPQKIVGHPVIRPKAASSPYQPSTAESEGVRWSPNQSHSNCVGQVACQDPHAWLETHRRMKIGFGSVWPSCPRVE